VFTFPTRDVTIENDLVTVLNDMNDGNDAPPDSLETYVNVGVVQISVLVNEETVKVKAGSLII
jgi:hypothetical protein